MTVGSLECSKRVVGVCAHDYTALPGETIEWEVSLQNNGPDEVELLVEECPPISLPKDSVQPDGEPFLWNGASVNEEGCVVLPCGGCYVQKYSAVVPEDANCLAITNAVRVLVKTDEVREIVRKNAKAGVSAVAIPVKPEIKTLVSETVMVGQNPDDVKYCPDRSGGRANDITGITQWMAAAFDDCTAAQFMDACDSGLSFLDVIKICITGTPLKAILDKNAMAEGIQGIDIDGDGLVGAVPVVDENNDPAIGVDPAGAPSLRQGDDEPELTGEGLLVPSEETLRGMSVEALKDEARSRDLAVSGNKDALVERILGSA